MTFMDSFRRVHVIGAGGIGVSAVARLLAHAGKQVTGSDVARGEITDDLAAAGISVAIGHDAANLPADADLVVFSDAVPPSNPERAEASRRGVTQLSYFQFLGKFSADRRTIAVSGTNGKSTTTAMLGLMLERGGLDPTVIVGSKVPTFPQRNLRLGNSDLFVVEADEYNAHMLELSPWLIVLTNIEEDHLDFYRDIDHIVATFREYVGRLPADGKLIANADDPLCAASKMTPPVTPVTFGMGEAAQYRAHDLLVQRGLQMFSVTRDGREDLGQWAMQIPGNFNVMNALAAAAAAIELGVSVETVVDTLRDFTGIWRRFEQVGECNGARLISDYGHHPTAVSGTLQAARSFYEGSRIVLAFQPHHHNRTRKLFNEFVASFDGADVLVLAEVYDVAGRENAAEQVSSRQLIEAVQKRDAERGVTREIVYAADAADVARLLRKVLRSGDVALVMGAGDIYTVPKQLQ